MCGSIIHKPQNIHWFKKMGIVQNELLTKPRLVRFHPLVLPLNQQQFEDQHALLSVFETELWVLGKVTAVSISPAMDHLLQWIKVLPENAGDVLR